GSALSTSLLGQSLPVPVLVNTGSEKYAYGVRYRFGVSNHAQYADVLFEPAPDLPPCGLNHNSARTWIQIIYDDGERTYGFCALKAAGDLQKLWVPVAAGRRTPQWIRVVITDRRTGREAESKLDIAGRPAAPEDQLGSLLHRPPGDV